MVVVSFHTTSEALAFEKAAQSFELPGRLGPVPRAVTAGCGFAWLAEDDERAALEAGIAANSISYEEITQI